MKFKVPANAKIETLLTENGTEYYSVNVSGLPDKLHIEWTEPMEGHYSVWHPTCGRWRQIPQWFCAQKTESCFYKGAPVLAAISADGTNKSCVAFSDTVTPVDLGFYVDDFSEKNKVIFTLDIEVKKAPYSAVLRIDRSRIPFEDAVHNAVLWWNEGKNKTVPYEAYAPLYSSWYSFHQNPDQKQLTEELRTASELGFRTFILDDGWQIEGNGTRDYLLSGDWNVAKEKFPDFGKFVSDVHSFGMKFMLWFAVPFAGFKTETFRHFEDKLLFKEEGFLNAGILDIRYPEVRSYITDTYCRFIREYDIDGLKLDFIDNFKCYKGTPACNPEMDCETVEEAVIVLLKEIRDSISGIKPGFLYEYRQFYVGPSILEYGNMVRVGDCAYDSVTNRIGVADLRILTDNIAVHSDMLLWSPAESPVNCAMQLLNVIFSTLQISVLLSKSTPEQKNLLKAFLKYTQANREVLLKGRFNASHPELNYTSLSSGIPEKNRRITVLYANEPYEYRGMDEDVWNGCFSDGMVIVNKKAYDMKITVTGFNGEIIKTFNSSAETVFVEVPPTGMLRINKSVKKP